MIVDANGHPIKIEKQKLELGEIGTTGLRRFGGHVAEEFHPKLQGRMASRIFREMSDNDAIIGGMLWAIESLVRQVPWESKEAGTDPKQLEAKELLDSAMNDMSHTWTEFMAEMVRGMLIFGWDWRELVWKVRLGNHKDAAKRSRFEDGHIGWRKFAIRSQDTLDEWKFDDRGGIQGMYQSAPPTYQRVLIPVEKSMLFRIQHAKGNPEGRSLLRNAYRSWWFLKRIQEIEAIGIERDLAGLPVLEVPPDLMSTTLSPTQQTLRTELELLVQQIRRDEREGVLIPAELDRDGKPTGYKLRLLTSGGRRSLDVNQTIVRYEQRIAMSVLAEFLMLGMDKVGSFALASTKTELFAVSLGAILDAVESIINRFAVSKLFTLNGFPPQSWAQVKHGDLEGRDLAVIGSYIQTLSNAGVLMPDEELERWAREQGGLPIASAPEVQAAKDKAAGKNENGKREPAEKSEDWESWEAGLVESISRIGTGAA